MNISTGDTSLCNFYILILYLGIPCLLKWMLLLPMEMKHKLLQWTYMHPQLALEVQSFYIKSIRFFSPNLQVQIFCLFNLQVQKQIHEMTNILTQNGTWWKKVVILSENSFGQKITHQQSVKFFHSIDPIFTWSNATIIPI